MGVSTISLECPDVGLELRIVNGEVIRVSWFGKVVNLLDSVTSTGSLSHGLFQVCKGKPGHVVAFRRPPQKGDRNIILIKWDGIDYPLAMKPEDFCVLS